MTFRDREQYSRLSENPRIEILPEVEDDSFYKMYERQLQELHDFHPTWDIQIDGLSGIVTVFSTKRRLGHLERCRINCYMKTIVVRDHHFMQYLEKIIDIFDFEKVKIKSPPSWHC